MIRFLSKVWPIIFLWMALSAVAVWAYWAYRVEEQTAQFIRYSVSVKHGMEEKLQAADAVLESFAAFQPAVDAIDFARETQYARQIVARYPEIFCLELIFRIEKKDLAQFTQLQRSRGYPDFSVHDFSYDAGRHIRPIAAKPHYYLLAFMEPASEQARREVVGLDVDALLGPSLSLSSDLNQAVVTQPFRLIEGDWAYLMVRPAGLGAIHHETPLERAHSKPLYVALVVKASSLQPDTMLPPGFSVVLHHHAFAATDVQGQLLQVATAPSSALESRIFPVWSETYHLDHTAQPFVLRVRWQPGFAQIGWPGVLLLCQISLFILFLLIGLSFFYHRSETIRRKNLGRLEKIANTDALTGLPNRRALDGMPLQASGGKHGAEQVFGVLYLDLDNFKPVNDLYGHEVGDGVLRETAKRLNSVLRADDLLVRLGGDEFVVLLKQALEHNQLDHLLERLQSVISQPYAFAGNDINLGVSIGVAHCPLDGVTMSALLKSADLHMYQEKNKKGRRTEWLPTQLFEYGQTLRR